MLAKKITEARNLKQPDPFKKIEFIKLSNIAIDIVAENFILYPQLQDISDELKNKIIDKVKSNIPVHIAATHIQRESYWKRACEAKWPHNQIQIELHGMSWKNAYLENYIEERLEGGVEIPKEELIDELKSINKYVYNLCVKQMKVQLDFSVILTYLPLITNLNLNFGLKHSGMNYQRQAFGMKLFEGKNLGDAIKNCYNLLSLKLQGNMIDDDLFRFIVSGLNLNNSLIELDFSHNLISDEGAKRLAKLIMRNDVIISINLCDNKISYEGISYFGYALKTNNSLQELNLRLNNLDDNSGIRIFKDLCYNNGIQKLDLSSNCFGNDTALSMAEYLSNSNCSIKQLDISVNNFDDKVFEGMKLCLNKNVSLQQFDIRNCQLTKGQILNFRK